jgi:hypothetical protein
VVVWLFSSTKFNPNNDKNNSNTYQDETDPRYGNGYGVAPLKTFLLNLQEVHPMKLDDFVVHPRVHYVHQTLLSA